MADKVTGRMDIPVSPHTVLSFLSPYIRKNYIFRPFLGPPPRSGINIFFKSLLLGNLSADFYTSWVRFGTAFELFSKFLLEIIFEISSCRPRQIVFFFKDRKVN